MRRATKKDVTFLGGSKERLRDMGEDLCDAFGADLLAVQWGLDPTTVKHMPHGLSEIKISDDANTHRLVYIAKYEEMIYALHAFTKKSNEGDRTPKRDKEMIDARLKEAAGKHAEYIQNQRQQQQKEKPK